MRNRPAPTHRAILISAGIALVAASMVVAIFVLRRPSVAGTWINETPVLDGQYGAAPGQLRIQANSDGTGLLVTDKDWLYEGFTYRVDGGHILVRLGLPDEVQSKGEFRFDYELSSSHLSLTAADGESEQFFPDRINLRRVVGQQ